MMPITAITVAAMMTVVIPISMPVTRTDINRRRSVINRSRFVVAVGRRCGIDRLVGSGYGTDQAADDDGDLV